MCVGMVCVCWDGVCVLGWSVCIRMVCVYGMVCVCWMVCVCVRMMCVC